METLPSRLPPLPWNAGGRVEEGLVFARRQVTNADGGEIPWLVPLSPQTKPSGMELDPDDEQDTLARNLGEENYDEKKLKKEHASAARQRHPAHPATRIPNVASLLSRAILFHIQHPHPS